MQAVAIQAVESVLGLVIQRPIQHWLTRRVNCQDLGVSPCCSIDHHSTTPQIFRGLAWWTLLLAANHRHDTHVSNRGTFLHVCYSPTSVGLGWVLGCCALHLNKSTTTQLRM